MQLRTSLMASFAALFLILAIPVMNPGRSAGFPVVIAKRPVYDMCDQRNTVVDVADEHSVRVHGPLAPLRTYELEPWLHEIFRTRAEAVVFIKGSGDLPFRRIAEIIDVASRQVDHVAILTPAVERQGGVCLTIKRTA